MQRRARSPNPYYAGPTSDHFDGVTFFNPDGQRPRGFGDLLRWQLGGGRARWPRAWPSPFPPARPDATVAQGALRVTFVNHSTVLVQMDGVNILTDPVWSDRVWPVLLSGPTRAIGLPASSSPTFRRSTRSSSATTTTTISIWSTLGTPAGGA